MNDILFGAGIALISSLALAILGYLYQANRDEQQRKWQIEDRNYQRELEILTNRLKQAEEYLNDQYVLAQKIWVFEIKLFTKPNKNSSLENEGIDSLLTEIANKEAYLQNLNDEKMIKLNKIFTDYVMGEMAIAARLNNDIKKGKTLKYSKKERNRINDFFIKASEIRRQMIKRIDQLGKLEKN